MVFKYEKEDGVIFIIVFWGFIDNLMDDIERVVDDGVNIFKVFIRDKCFVFGGGVIEIELVK